MTRVRFAPSPTGYLHIGGARTALFNWLYARNQGGKFILRIEDTDQKRSQEGYLKEILESMQWLGMDWDELYYQGQRFALYREHAERLLKEGKAYTQAGQGEGTTTEAILLKTQIKNLVVEDIIHGQINFDTGVIKDQVLIKSDGSPAYNFSCVVDDCLMDITHVIRGDDHISNTPKQVLMYEAMGYPLPKFAHLPLIMDPAGGRLSKRAGATAVSEFRQMGFLAEALVNYLLLLGWSPGADQEIIALAEATQRFSLEKANKTASAFDMDKLRWINSQYIMAMRPQDLLGLAIPFWKAAGFSLENFDGNFLLGIVQLFQNRISTLAELPERSDFFFTAIPQYQEEAVSKYLRQDLRKEFGLLRQRFSQLSSFSAGQIDACFRALVAELGIKTSSLIHPVRVALTGKTAGPGLFELASLLGRECVLRRLEHAMGFMDKVTKI